VARAWARHPVVAFFRHRQQLSFYRQLHALVRSGTPLPTAFAELSRYAPDARLKAGLEAVAREVRDGATLGEAFGHQRHVFDDANVELIAFAEEAGTLDPVLEALLLSMEELQRLRWQTLMYSLWPAYLATAVIFVGPLLGAAQSAKDLSSVGAVYVSGLVRNLLTAAFGVAVVLGAPLLIAAAGQELAWDRFKRSLPGLSGALRDLAASRFVLGLGLSLGAGLEIVRGVRVAVLATSSPSLAARLPEVEGALRSGSSLVDAVARLELLDPSSLGQLAVGERTGTLAGTLPKLSRELQEGAVRAMKFLMLALIVVFAGLMLVFAIQALLGTMFGPIKHVYDAAGSGAEL
jgi:type II secretory pathway component PulF